ncbi:hypothetical protein Bealeia2_01914 (plasmid) [Candidatus Bealeia paramacronuclearis]|uniref:hypothetical protein n=1 Tax=Candidatus Bealeia paramacronuclearis TaxID=1921001 RepID=UPI002BD23E0A|nr:hypothetical protein [Candidatus Bealeia paramacronuclearis]
MADVSKLKKITQRHSILGEPPPLQEASHNLTAPEIAPLPVLAISDSQLKRKRDGRIDGRSARRTKRTVQFATRVTPDWDERIRQLALHEGVLLVEILEKALSLYEEKYSSQLKK